MPDPQPPAQQTQAEEPRRTARQVFMDYGVATVALLLWLVWCIRDGWFNEGYEYIGFSRVMAYITTPIFIFCLIMASSAGFAYRRERDEKTPPHA